MFRFGDAFGLRNLFYCSVMVPPGHFELKNVCNLLLSGIFEHFGKLSPSLLKVRDGERCAEGCEGAAGYADPMQRFSNIS